MTRWLSLLALAAALLGGAPAAWAGPADGPAEPAPVEVPVAEEAEEAEGDRPHATTPARLADAAVRASVDARPPTWPLAPLLRPPR